jgi:hypothetical protein
MKTAYRTNKQNQAAYALLTVTVMAGVSIALYASLAQLTSNSTVINDRNNTYNSAVAAAEGASERVLSYLARDFFSQSFDPANLDFYRNLIPRTDWSTGYQFGDGTGAFDRTFVTVTPNMAVTNLNSQFAGLYGMAYACTVRSCATPLGTPYKMTAAVQQDVQLAAIPVFQFAIFYAMDLEVNPGPQMKVTGKVHSNANLYTAPVSGLEYVDDVTAVGQIYNNRMPGDPTSGGKVTPVYRREHMDNASSLTLPVGTNNSPVAVRQILEAPPFDENPSSPVGRERYFNKCDLLITTTDTRTTVTTGDWNGFATLPPDVAGTSNTPPRYSFITTNASFYDEREGKSTVLTELNVGLLNQWLGNTTTNGGASVDNFALFQLGHHVNSIYVRDTRVGTGKLTAVRVKNGQLLPQGGLTVATVLPLYVQGHFNAPDTTPASTNTSATKAASLLGDSITVLSGNWLDSHSTSSSSALSQRLASETTVNAAFLAGIVPTVNVNGGRYSGGVENFPRFLEDWSNKTFTYNGSMVVMFPSQYATSYWVAPGTYYQAPTRKWAFDVNFLDYAKLPPATPVVRKLVRGQWSVVAGL